MQPNNPQKFTEKAWQAIAADLSIQRLQDKVDSFIASQPKVSNSNGSVFLGRSLDTLLDRAEKYRTEFGDDYISVEHLVLGFAKDDRFGRQLFMFMEADDDFYYSGAR